MAYAAVALMLLPRAEEKGMTALVRVKGALNGSGNALNAKPKLSSIVSACFRTPLSKNRVVLSRAPRVPAV